MNGICELDSNAVSVFISWLEGVYNSDIGEYPCLGEEGIHTAVFKGNELTTHFTLFFSL